MPHFILIKLLTILETGIVTVSLLYMIYGIITSKVVSDAYHDGCGHYHRVTVYIPFWLRRFGAMAAITTGLFYFDYKYVYENGQVCFTKVLEYVLGLLLKK
jgi:hypothetical protein